MKLIIFDLDGVLIDSKDIHHSALNKAIELFDKNYIISEHEQKNIYEGLPTKTKLKILSERTGLNPDFHEIISKNKQKITIEMFNQIKKDEQLISFCKIIKKNNI